MTPAVFLALAAISHPARFEPPVRFDGHCVVRVFPADDAQARAIAEAADDVWACEIPSGAPFQAQFRVDRLGVLDALGARYELTIPDVQAYYDQRQREIRAINSRGAVDGPDWFLTYKDLAAITARMTDFAGQNPDLASMSTIGSSIQSRPIDRLIVTGPGNSQDRPVFFIVGGQHAREWVNPMAVMYIVDRLIETYDTDPRIKRLMDAMEFHIMPVANPDGYAYTWTTNPNWRKNRRDNPGSSCDGVDLNRNWGFQWGLNGSSSNPCNDTFRGASAFSEPETQVVAAAYNALAPRIVAFWDVHTNAELLLHPWGYTPDPCPHAAEFDRDGREMRDAIFAVHGNDYVHGPSSTTLYLVSGGARDWAYGVHGSRAWTIEVGGANFQPPSSAILPLCEEIFAGFLVFAERYAACPADCDTSTGVRVLDIFDFLCFQNRFAAADPYACECDASTGPAVCDIFDFLCFQNAFAAGCSN